MLCVFPIVPSQMLAEICHSGYTDALHFLLERGEQLLPISLLPLPPPPGVWPRSLDNCLSQVCSGGKVFLPA